MASRRLPSRETSRRRSRGRLAMETNPAGAAPAPQETHHTPMGTNGVELRPKPPLARVLSKRGGRLGIGLLGLVVALVIYGIFTRQDAAGNFGKRGQDLDKRVMGAKEAAKQFTNPAGSVDLAEAKDELDPPPLAFLPRSAARNRTGAKGPGPQGRVAGGTGPVASNTVPATLRESAGQGSAGQGTLARPLASPPTGWEPPTAPAWSGGGGPGRGDDLAAQQARRQDREREAMDAATGINGAGAMGGRMPTAQGDVNELAGVMTALTGIGTGSGNGGGPRMMPQSNNFVSGRPRDADEDGGSAQDDRDGFLRKARKGSGSDNYVQSTRVRPLSAFEIKAGWDIPAVLEQDINSDLPGEIRALVRENVYDTASGHYLLIPQGSRLVGTYDSKVAYAQSALLVVWSRIIFPDASSIELEGMSSQDVKGQSGLRGKVNHHYARLIGTAALSSAFSIAAVVAQNRRQNVFTLPSTQDVAASAAASEIARLGAAITRKNLNIQPTIRILTGTRFSVRVHRDLLLEAPYRPYPQGGRRALAASN
jgi:type IV secretory pathway VirB10-like protein